MAPKDVVIVSANGLFREGLKRLLAKTALIKLATSIQGAEVMARTQNVDVVIVDQADDQATRSEVISHLLSIPGLRVITVSLEADHIQVYYPRGHTQHREVSGASEEALIAAIMD